MVYVLWYEELVIIVILITTGFRCLKDIGEGETVPVLDGRGLEMDIDDFALKKNSLCERQVLNHAMKRKMFSIMVTQ